MSSLGGFAPSSPHTSERPSVFTDINGLRRPVVALATLIEDDDQVVLASPEDKPEDTATLLLNTDTEWVFAIQLILLLKPERLQRFRAACLCTFTLDDRRVRLRIGDEDKPLSLNIDDTASFQPALETLYTHYRAFLQLRPPTSGRKQQMGFLAGDEF